MKEQDILALLGASIKRFRQRSGWSQAALAERINISIPFLSNLEQGKTWASPATLLKLVDIFNIEVYELFKPAGRLSPGVARLLDKYHEDARRALDDFHYRYARRLSQRGQ